MIYDYAIGMDVGKYFHHACVLDIDGAPCERGLGSFLYCAASNCSLRLAAKLRSSTELSAGRC